MIKAKKSGVSFYLKGRVEIGFPDGNVCCAYCPLLETYARNMCRRTGEYIADIKEVGYYCPLQFKEGENEI